MGIPSRHITSLEATLDRRILEISPVAGGDISKAYRLTTSMGPVFLKSMGQLKGSLMYRAEAQGLETIGAANTIAVPKILAHVVLENIAYLAMEHIEAKHATPRDFERFGQQLGLLHAHKGTNTFGFESDNYIGSLPQKNTMTSSWAEFYAHQRLWPQLQLAFDSGLLKSGSLKGPGYYVDRIKDYVGEVTPSLLHGDLWGGNFLISKEGVPHLIDPAAYRGHSLVDIAMSKLFGGFGPTFYEGYHEIVPSHPNEHDLIHIYQLYYLLVHLNLFGSSYLSSVQQLLQRYF